MPQLDPTFYTTQLFWLIVIFTLLFLVVWKVALPRIANIREARRTRIDADLENKLVAFLSRFAELKSPSAAIKARRTLVRKVQENLIRLGFELGDVDGLLGQRTREAVRAFQTSLGINPTGNVSEELLLLLEAR